MSVPRGPMPQIVAALQLGQWQEALRLLLEQPGAARRPLDAMGSRPAPRPAQPAPDDAVAHSPARFGVPAPLPPGVTQALARGQKQEAIRLLRQHQGLGLREARARIEDHIARHMDAMPHLAPGQVDDNATGSFVLLVVVLLAFVAYRYFRG